MRTLAMLVVLLVTLPAMARARPPKAPKPPKDVAAATRMLRHYVNVEKRVVNSLHAVPSVELVAHWQELHALRLGLARLEKRGELRKLKEGRRVAVRHALAQLLGEQTDVALENNTRLERAHSQRTEDLFAIGELARRSFDIVTADANGAWRM
jgi:hypothetical protein